MDQFDLSTDTAGSQRQDPTLAWRRLITRFCQMARDAGIDPGHADSDTAPYFARLGPTERQGVFADFARYVEVCEDVVIEGRSLKQNRHLLWRMLKRLGLVPKSDLFSHISDTDRIEVYDTANTQMFRSLNFFPICSHSLDALQCRPWWELFQRDEAVLAKLVGISRELVSGSSRETQIIADGRHGVREINSARLYRALVNYKVVSPIFNTNHECAGFVTVFEVLSCVPER